MRMTSMRVLVLAAVLPAGAAWAQSTAAGGFSLPGSSGSSGSSTTSTQATGTATTGAGAFDPAVQAAARLFGLYRVPGAPPLDATGTYRVPTPDTGGGSAGASTSSSASTGTTAAASTPPTGGSATASSSP
ncbi:MAG: hypothetical protein ACXWK9_07395 [Myxococcaceae bacterium]